MTDTLPVYVINRAQDEARLQRFMASAAALDLEVRRVEALDGHDLDAPFFLYRQHLGTAYRGSDLIKPGAFACFLSHIAAWKRMIADDVDAALICEDDVVLNTAPVSFPKDYDLIFVNKRMQGWLADDADDLTSLPDVIAGMKADNRMPGSDTIAIAPGADAYVLTRAGAQKLISLVCSYPVTTGVDWALLGFSLPKDALKDWAEAVGTPQVAVDQVIHSAVSGASVGGASGAIGGSVIQHKSQVSVTSFAPQPEIDLPPGGEHDPVRDALAAGEYPEVPALEMMYRWMPDGGIFVDIGAHIGGHTMFMLRHGGASRSIVFEFHPAAIEQMGILLQANGIEDRVDRSNLGYALAEETGRLAVRGGNKSAYYARLKPDFVEEIRVRAGDTLLRDEPRIDMIKIDVNGEERDVLKGLKKTMKRKQPLIALDMSAAKTAKVEGILARHFYRQVESADWEENGQLRRFALFRCEKPPQTVGESIEVVD